MNSLSAESSSPRRRWRPSSADGIARAQLGWATLGITRRRWAWLTAVLMIGTLALVTFLATRAESHFFFRQQVDYYATQPVSEQVYAPTEPAMPPAVTVLIRIGGRLLNLLSAWLGWAVALYLAVIFMGQNGTGFGATLALTLWSWVPYLVRGWIQSVYLLLTHRPIFNPGLSGFIIDKTPPPMAMSFVPFIPPTRVQLVWAALLSRLDIYLIWQLLWLILGLTTLTRLPHKKAVLTVMIIWLILTLLGLIPVMFESSFARFRF